jgi:hypothetical protein
MSKYIFTVWMKCLVDVINQEIPDDRAIYWMWELINKETGRKEFINFMIKHYGALYVDTSITNPKTSIVHYHEEKNLWPKLIVLDVFNKIDYSLIESVKDGMFYENGINYFMNRPHLIVFSDRPPDITMMSIDRWHIMSI